MMGAGRLAATSAKTPCRTPRALAAGAFGVAIGIFSLAASAQTITPSGEIQPGQIRPLPEAPLPNFDFRIESPRPSPVPRAVEELSFRIKDIEVTGATVYPPSAFQPLTRPLIGRSVHLSDIIHVADAIEAKYRGDGYVLTRAYVPAQSVNNGVFRIAVVEGYVAAVSVTGGTADARERVERVLAPIPASRPLKLDVIETALLKVNDLPGVNVSGLLRPSPTMPGASDLVATVSAERVTAILSIDNRGAPLTDAWTASADFAIRSPLGEGGVVLLDLAAAPDEPHIRNSIAGKYVYPIGDNGLLLTLSALDSHGQPVGGVGASSFVSDNQAYGARLTYPLIVTRDSRLSIDGGFTWQDAFLQEFAGTVTDHDHWREVDLALIYQQNTFFHGVTSATLDLTQGLDILGASPAGDPNVSHPGAVPNFTKLSAIIRRIQQIYGRFSLALTGTGQYAFNTLYIGEEISFGGAQIGRGYDPAAITGDMGLGVDAELRYDLNLSGVRIDSPRITINHAELYSFYDAAKVWMHTGTISPDFIDSTGFGARAVLEDRLQLGVEAAFPLLAVPTSDYGKRAMRVLFNGSIKF
ncbi:MAG TPA: POTRA domain-containing protein [Stellaceae bacterium]|jgi:hemolysin activation/secretion protein|nr:POTRA domain-containing protein [Stellaceae bacterium]